MKRLLLFWVLFVTALTIAGGCGNENYKTPDQQAKEMQVQIMECFKNKDKEKLKSLFSKYAIDNCNLDKQIDEAFDFIDGEIISYDEPFPSACGSLDKKSYGAETENIKTDKGAEYSIGFQGWLTNNEKSDEVGVMFIEVDDKKILDSLPDGQKGAQSKNLDKYARFIGDQYK